MPTPAPKPVFFRETLRLALLGALAAYVHVAFFYVANWVSTGSTPGWEPIVGGFWGVLRNLSAALFFHPALGFVAGLVVGALCTLAAGLLRLDSDRRRTAGVVAVAVTAFAVLGLPWPPSEIFTRNLLAVGYAVKLLLGVGFVWAALRAERVVGAVARIAGFALSGSALLWVLFALVFQGLFTSNETKTAVPPGPNVVLILSDALRADVTSLYGGKVPTPNLERLAARGVTFERCFSTSCWTIPAVTAMFTGLAPEVTGMDSFISRLPRLPYLPERLADAGYRTWAMMGNPLLSPKAGFDRGFDRYLSYDENFYGQGFLGDSGDSIYNEVALAVNRLLTDLDPEGTVALGPRDALEMLRSLDPAGGAFLYVHLFDPHAPYRPPERLLPETGYEGRYEEESLDFRDHADELTGEDLAQLKRLYEGEVRLVDEFLGRALDIADDRGLWENTAFIFLSDHGEEFMEHGGLTHSGVNLQHELTHVPLVVYWPGRLDGGGRVTGTVSLCDLFPTVLDGLGLEGEMEPGDGRSLFEPVPRDRAVFAQRCLDECGRSFDSDFVVRGGVALFVNRTSGVRELYLDYPDHTGNALIGHRELAERMELLLDEWHSENDALSERLGAVRAGGTVDPAQLEKLRSLGYLQ
ncbi:MAG TPA: sulfatase [bacterium]|nr:sulfatase [bacterium]